MSKVIRCVKCGWQGITDQLNCHDVFGEDLCPECGSDDFIDYNKCDTCIKSDNCPIGGSFDSIDVCAFYDEGMIMPSTKV